MMPRYAMTYVVYWPERGVLKVGRAWRFSRVQMMTMSGGRIVVLARGTDASWEREALRALREWFPTAFRNEREASGLLFMGRGWTECFEVDEHHLQLAVDLCFEGFARGNDQGVNEEKTAGDPAGAVAGAEPDRVATRGAGDGDEALGVRGRPGPRGAEIGPDRGARRTGSGGDAASRGASAGPVGVGLPDDVSGGGSLVDSAGVAAEDAETEGLGLPAEPAGTFRRLPGCGGRARAGGGAGACAGGRAGGGVGGVGASARALRTAAASAPPAGTSHRMPRAPGRQIRGLWPMRDGTPPPRSLGRAGAPHAPRHGVRGGGDRR